jgi:polyisoprenoid-binding protein YceI
MKNYQNKILILLLASASTLFAGNFSVDQSKSELSATMHASPSHDFTSVATDYQYDIEIDPETLQVKKANCSFKFRDLDSGKSSRDKKMRKWINVEKYPTAKFEMQSQLPDNEAGEHVAAGVFTMHGTSLPMNIAYSVEKVGDQIILKGHTVMDHENWGLEQVKLFIFSVDTVLKPEFHLIGTLTPDA